jgi:phage tail sheath protein FI
MPTYKTPDVYVEEISVFPPSVAEVETAIPAFIGYTHKAQKKDPKDLIKVPKKIYSFVEYEQYYGNPETEVTTVNVTGTAATGFKISSIKAPDLSYWLYYCVKMFFDNGGGQCYIVSVDVPTAKFDKDDFLEALGALRSEDEPTLIVAPEVVNLTYAEYKEFVTQVLLQCNQLKDRFAIIDTFNGYKEPDEEVQITPQDKEDLIAANRLAWDGDLKYGAAYYPFVRTTMNRFFFESEDGKKSNVEVKIGATAPKDLLEFKVENAVLFNLIRAALKDEYLVLPPSGAVAGVYAATDTNRGVWKAPANVGLADVLAPVVKLDSEKQAELNVDTSGKSINAIREFSGGRGTKIWGARTLAGNDLEWRYISVRRFFNMVEESVKKSTYWAVFENNDANTWVKVRGMIENYLTQKWREGALAGATPKEAFYVRCGLGTTMTSIDILEGRMIVEIGMAVVRPAEFIILKFMHKMQTS